MTGLAMVETGHRRRMSFPTTPPASPTSRNFAGPQHGSKQGQVEMPPSPPITPIRAKHAPSPSQVLPMHNRRASWAAHLRTSSGTFINFTQRKTWTPRKVLTLALFACTCTYLGAFLARHSPIAGSSSARASPRADAKRREWPEMAQPAPRPRWREASGSGAADPVLAANIFQIPLERVMRKPVEAAKKRTGSARKFGAHKPPKFDEARLAQANKEAKRLRDAEEEDTTTPVNTVSDKADKQVVDLPDSSRLAVEDETEAETETITPAESDEPVDEPVSAPKKVEVKADSKDDDRYNEAQEHSFRHAMLDAEKAVEKRRKHMKEMKLRKLKATRYNEEDTPLGHGSHAVAQKHAVVGDEFATGNGEPIIQKAGLKRKSPLRKLDSDGRPVRRTGPRRYEA